MEAYRTAYVYVRGNLAGYLKETDSGYSFTYDKEYLADNTIWGRGYFCNKSLRLSAKITHHPQMVSLIGYREPKGDATLSVYNFYHLFWCYNICFFRKMF